jgi:hypothetical protein
VGVREVEVKAILVDISLTLLAILSNQKSQYRSACAFIHYFVKSTAFAPDFQALPNNVEYLECEDEFDIVEDEDGMVVSKEEDDCEDETVDILTIEPVPVFQSDSEDEADVFSFRSHVTKGRGGGDNNTN